MMKNSLWLTYFTLLLGMDMLKHGESAYPADAWVEQQYMKEDALSGGVSNFCFLAYTLEGAIKEFWGFKATLSVDNRA